MLKGKSLVELAQAVQDRASRKVDVIADTTNITFDVADGKPLMSVRSFVNPHAEMASNGNLVAHGVVTPHALNQITEHAGVPRGFADRLIKDEPELARNVITTLLNHNPQKRMIRVLRDPKASQMGLSDTIRGFMSNKYQRHDDIELLATVLPELHGNPNVEVLSTELTDTRMYMKVVFPRMEGEVKKGDLVQYGFTLSNSEIGGGALSVMPFFYRLVCLNGMTAGVDVDDTRMRKTHLGRALAEGVDFYSDEALQADDRAVQLKLRDTLRAFMDPVRWQAVLARLQAAANTDAAANPLITAQKVAETFLLPQAETNKVLENFLRDGDYTKWGMLNAVTAVANTHESYDRATELEAIGGRILSLPATDWSRFAKAA